MLTLTTCSVLFMSIDAIKEFYNYTFEDKSIQRALIDTKTTDEFVDRAIELAANYGYSFTKNEFVKTMDGFGINTSFSEVHFDNEWIKKVMQVGWVPLGYTRN